MLQLFFRKTQNLQCQGKQCLVTTSNDKYQYVLKLVFTGFSVSILILSEYFNQIQNSNAERSADMERDNPVLNADTEIHTSAQPTREYPTEISTDALDGKDSRHELPSM